MKKRKTAWMLAVCLTLCVMAGCGGEKQEIFEQAGRDLEQGNYEYALTGYETAIANGTKLAHSYRGAGIVNLRMGNYEAAIASFTSALGCERVSKALRKDILSYRASAELKAGQYENAMSDCQTLAEEYTMDMDIYFLTGQVALAMDAYDEAASNFEQAFAEDSSYDTAIRIYETYLAEDMEADGTRYLEAALVSDPKNAEDYCDRGRVYYYMKDYTSAQSELIQASREGSTEALLLLGMVYLAQNDVANARSMYQEYVSKEGTSAKGYNGLALCDLAEGNYDSALLNISNGLPNASTEEMQDLLFNEIVIYEKKLDFVTACQKAEEYLGKFPDDEAVSRELVFLRTRQ